MRAGRGERRSVGPTVVTALAACGWAGAGLAVGAFVRRLGGNPFLSSWHFYALLLALTAASAGLVVGVRRRDPRWLLASLMLSCVCLAIALPLLAFNPS